MWIMAANNPELAVRVDMQQRSKVDFWIAGKVDKIQNWQETVMMSNISCLLIKQELMAESTMCSRQSYSIWKK